jgi:hypothetical protein
MEKNINYITLGQAAKETGRSKSTIFKAIKNGTLSYVEKTSSGYKLNPEEVFIVFPENDLDRSQSERSRTFAVSTEHSQENDYLRRENELLRQQIEHERDYIQDLRRRLDEEAAERRNLMRLLTHQPEQKPAPEQPKSLLWQKLFGRT